MKSKCYIKLPPGIVELGFMSKEQYEELCIELQGGMYGNVDAALLYYIRCTDYATKKNGLDMIQSLADPCVFYKKDGEGRRGEVAEGGRRARGVLNRWCGRWGSTQDIRRCCSLRACLASVFSGLPRGWGFQAVPNTLGSASTNTTARMG